MTAHGYADIQQALSWTRDLLNGRLLNEERKPTNTLVVTGPPCSGKTSFALGALLEGMRVLGAEDAVMVVSGRKAAARMSRRVIEARGVVDQSRPVGTLAALAFRVLSAAHLRKGQPMPKLLNGAEQEALLRRVLAEHVQHVLRGEPCDSCALIARYYGSVPSWIDLLGGRGAGGRSARQTGAQRAEGAPAMHGAANAADVRDPKGRGGEPGAAPREDGNTFEDLSLATEAAGISADFVAQLRDTLARVNELGLEFGDEDEVIAALRDSSLPVNEREQLELQWQLTFRLWREYAEHIERRYPKEARLDSSRLLVEAAEVVGEAPSDIPALLVVDDWQDVTLAGMTLLQSLANEGCRLVLVGNSDEAVQIFRGSYPEYLEVRVTTSPQVHDASGPQGFGGATASSRLYANAHTLGRLGAKRAVLVAKAMRPQDREDDVNASSIGESAPMQQRKHSYLDVLASRVSLGIPSEEEENLALPLRPGKLPQWEGTLPVRKLLPDSALPSDGSVEQRLFRTADEELSHIVWQIKHESLSRGRDWNDMAIIAHDNATVEVFGQRLREEGVPVRYSSVTRPLKDEAVVQGLFALIELSQRQCDDALLDSASRVGAMPDAAEQAEWIGARMRILLSSPLLKVQPGNESTQRPVRVQRLEMLMDSCAALATLGDAPHDDALQGEALHDETVQPDGGEPGQASSDVELSNARRLQTAWHGIREAIESRRRQRFEASGITIDDSLTASRRRQGGGAGYGGEETLNGASLYAVLLLGDQESRDCLLSMMGAIASGGRSDPDVEALRAACTMMSRTAQGLASLDSEEPEYALWQAWDACGKAEQWQRDSLEATHRGEVANDRLDAVMRLFQFASGSQTFENVAAFIEQVRGMQIEADSLAHIGPVEQAVTLTTPAGAVAEDQRWPLVWLPQVQQGVWPNLTERDTLFGTEDLAELVMRYGDDSRRPSAAYGNRRLRATLYAEKKNLLMALTRASQRVIVSAVWNDDSVPSDFVFGYLPELCPRVSDSTQAAFTEVGSGQGEKAPFGGLEVSARGLVTIARSVLAQEIGMHDGDHGDARVQDAVATLSMLAKLGYSSADPDAWAFRSPSAPSPAGSEPADPTLPEQAEDAVGNDDGAAFGGTVLSSTVESVAPSVTLSPSAVDSIWMCPLEWAVDNRLSGPRPGSIYMSFGTVIHHVAQAASERGLDASSWIHQHLPSSGQQALIADIAEQMMGIYREYSADLIKPPDYVQSYDLRRRDAIAETIMSNIASYFVRSVQDDYAQSGKLPVPVGELAGVECELPFMAAFSMSDILPLWNTSYGDQCPLDQHELFAVMSALVGGFPKALDEGLVVRLSGRIDRLEHRIVNGAPVVRLLDYKTGKAHARAKVFSDLQLVCYQLGQYFGAGEHPAPQISQAVLFDVSENSAPAYSRQEESSYQPALIRGKGLNTVFAPRSGVTKLAGVFKGPELPEDAPEGVSDSTWRFVLQQQGQQGIWSLTMMARVFFAAGVKLSLGTDLAEFDADRCQNNGRGECPAWMKLHGNVMEDGR
ncbi:PD-(D/E)XK nuclease family protein [Bifidobacterium psychraerophilum]|uniref:PD-(D/E)XK nuclease family protein n=1 Tax=Bifidobacterium psychraerophilum TaxID=218140 RepID=UPI0039EBE4C1